VRPVRTIIIGIGNPVLSDDAVGLRVAAQLREAVDGSPEVAVTELCAGGIRLVEAMAGYERAILVDAIQTQGGKPGSVYALDPADMAPTRNIFSTHEGSLDVALELGRMIGLRVPDEIRIWGVEAADVATFGESLTTEVARAVPRVVNGLISYLGLEGPVAQETNA